MFKDVKDATKAYKEYNNAELDNKIIRISFLADSELASKGGAKPIVKVVWVI